MRVLIVGINYRPELTGIGPYTAGLAEHLAARGDDVTVLTGLPHYPAWALAPRTPRAMVRAETLAGVHVVRSAHYIPTRQSAVRRAAYEATFGLTSLAASLTLPRPDAVLGVVPSLSGGVLARLSSARWGSPYGLLFQDLMGPAARQSGVPGGGPVASATTAAEAWATRGAAAVGVVSPAFVPYLESMGVADDRIHHVPNWSRPAVPSMGRAETRRRFGWPTGLQVVLHAGNIGYKQGLEQVIEAATMAGSLGEPVRFVLVGRGNQETTIRRAAEGLANVEFLGVQPDDVHASLLAAADVLLLSERATQLDMSLPSKLTSYFASGRPIVAAVPPGGPSADEVERSGAGIVVAPGAPAALLATLARLREAPELAARLGARGPVHAAAATSAANSLAAGQGFVDAIASGG